MTVEEVRRECHKLGWNLIDDVTYEDAGEYEHVSGVTWTIGEEGVEIGRGDTPREAYHEACKAEGRSPY